MGVLLASSFLAPSALRAQGTTDTRYTQVNVANFGARDDAQDTQEISLPTGTRCAVTNSGSPVVTTVDCGITGLFATGDIYKTIEVPAAGTGTPAATFIGTICALEGSGNTGVTLCSPVNTIPPHNVYVTWGTLNDGAFNAAANACPLNTTVVPIAPFTSRGCVLIVPVGPNGTGSYMFGTSGVTMTTQTSLQIIGAGNSARQDLSTQAGVRLVTAANITILTIGSPLTNGAPDSNYGGFQLSNISFRDTSGPAGQTAVTPGSGAAIGGLHIQNVSEAKITECSFENFDGVRNGASGDFLLSYGIFADPVFGSNAGVVASGFNNNIILIHDKGRNNSVFYDSSLPGQDGPIVIGGDIFPENNVNTLPGLTTATGAGAAPLSGACYGFITAGPIRMYGTHIDSRVDTTPQGCVGILMESGGIVSYKNESAMDVSSGLASDGGGAYLLGGSALAEQLISVTGTTTFYPGFSVVQAILTLVGTTSPFTIGQLISISTSSMHFNATYRLAFATTTVISGATHPVLNFYVANPPTGTDMGGMATGFPTRDVDIDMIANATGPGDGVIIGLGALNNRIHIVSAGQSSTTALPPYTNLNTTPGDGNEVNVADAINGATFRFDGGSPALPVFQDVFSITAGPGAPSNAAPPVLSVIGGTGGSANTMTGAGQAGGPASVTTGAGSAATAGGVGGTGGLLSLATGPGAAGAGAANGNGGSILIETGPAGTGGTTGTGTPGAISLTIGGATNGVELNSSNIFAGIGSGSITANTVPASGISGTISLTTQVSGTLPIINGGTGSSAATVPAHTYFGNHTGGSVAPAFVVPDCADLSDSQPSCSIDATNAANISSGTLPAARLPNPSATTLGGIESFAPVTHEWINQISTSGVPSATQPSITDITNVSTNGTAQFVYSSNGTIAPANGDYLPVSGLSTQTGTQTNFEQVMARPGVAVAMYCQMNTGSNGATSTTSFTLQVNGSSPLMGLVCTIGNSASSGSDTTHRVSWNAGDVLDILVGQINAATTAVYTVGTAYY